MTSSTSTTPSTLATSLAENAAVRQAVDTIVRELAAAQSAITGARPPVREMLETYEQYLKRQADIKGRSSFYPYIGSGFGNGPLVELADGAVKWDMINGIGVHMFGHSDPDMVATAVRAAMGDTVMQGNLQYNAETIDFAELLVAEASRTSNIRQCFLTNSGAMANESALKICMQKREGKAPRVMAFAHCFLGRSTTMAQIGDSAAGRVGLPLNVHVDYLPFYDPEHGDQSIQSAVDCLEQYIRRYPGQHACFVMELVQGEGGFNIAPREFFVPLMELCKANNISVWLDEVQTFGRTESMFHFEQLDLGEYVDVVSLGKMSQVCACLYTEEMSPKPGLLSGTFVGSTVGLNVGLRILQRLRDEGYYGPDGRIAQLQRAFREHAKALVDNHPEWFPAIPHPSGLPRKAADLYGGVGGMMRFTPFGGDKAKILSALRILFARGVIAFYCGHGPFHIRFLPPVGVMQPEQFEEVFAIVEDALDRVAARS